MPFAEPCFRYRGTAFPFSLRTFLTIIVGMLALSVHAQEIYTGAIAISPSVPTNSWRPTNTLAPGDSAKLSITVAQTGSYNGRNYTLHGNPIQHPPISSPPGSIIWRGNYSSLHACNAGNSPGTTTATVTAEWIETGGGGGGGTNGGSPSIIYGEATGIAQADIPVFSWSFDRRMQYADGTSPITYTVTGTIAGRRVSMNAYSVKALSGELSVTNNTPESTNIRTGKITSTNSAKSKMGVYYGERELARSDDEIAFAKVDLIVSQGPGTNRGSPLPEDRQPAGGTAPATNELNPGTIVLLLPQDQTNRVATTLTLKADPTGGSVTLDQHGLTDLKIYTNEALQQELPIPKTWTNGDTPPSLLYMVCSSSSTNLQSSQGTLDLTYKANLAADGGEYSIKDTVGVTLLPFELNSDLNNDGKAGEGSDSSLKTAALQSGANNDAKEKGTEYLFVNDQFSNGLWDKEDSDSSKPASENKDDDITELKTICAATWGAIWFEFEGGDISKLEFWKNKECTEAFTFDPAFALSESNKIPDKLYVRTKGDWTGQVEGKLIMKLGKPDKSETWAEDKLLFTVVKWVGDSKFFHASRDYILENNTRFYATQKDYGGEKMRTVVMRQEATSMKAQDTFYRNPKLRGIDSVVGAFSSQAVIVNGNFGDSVSLLPPETTKCLGRLISGGALDTSMSLDSTQSSSVFASSNAYYVAQSGSTFTFAKGEVPLTEGYQEALGGLYRDYPSAESDASTMIGQAPVGDKKVIFVNVTDMNTSSTGAGNGVIGFKDDATTGSGATEVYLLDGSSSSALAYQKPDGTLARQFKGSKHNTPLASPYYIHTYLMFECAKPRSN